MIDSGTRLNEGPIAQPEVEKAKNESAKFAPYLSYDNYLIENQIGLVNSFEKGRSALQQSATANLNHDRSDRFPTTDAEAAPQVEVKLEPNLDLVEDQNFDPNEGPKFVSQQIRCVGM